MKFREIEMNTAVVVTCLCLAVEEKLTKTNTTYVTVTMSDGDEIVTANKWDMTKEAFPFKENTLMAAKVNKRLYNAADSYTIVELYQPPADAKIEDYIKKADINFDMAFNELFLAGRKMKDLALGALVCDTLSKYKKQFMYWSAAKMVHHNLYGGLLYHSYRMYLTAKAIAPIYPMINEDILYAGVILHDIGKLRELETTETGAADYTIDGKLFGHALMGIQLLTEIINDSVIFISDESKRQLFHIIASHHGKMEHGAITAPSTLEAFLVHQIDMIDSKTYQFEEILHNVEPGTLSDKIFGLDNNRIYVPVQ